jgi:hypothetical protein
MKRIFISQPMRGKTNDEIEKERYASIRFIERYVREMHKEDIELVDTFFKEFLGNRLQFLGKSIGEGLARCDIAVFIGDWNKYSGCLCEHFIASRYGIETLYYSGSDEE